MVRSRRHSQNYLRRTTISISSTICDEFSAQFCRKSMKLPGDMAGGDDAAHDSLVNVNDEYKADVDSESVKKKEISEPTKIDVEKFAKQHDKANVSFHIATITKPQEEYKILVNNGNVPFEHVLLERSEDNLRFIHPLVSYIFQKT